MLLSPSPRGSFSVPVHISLHNVRRRRTREFVQYQATVQTSQWKRDRGGEKAKAQAPVSSVGEERALILGFTMMAFSILMFFVVGIAVVRPCFHSEWGEATNCSVIQAEFLNESDDWRATSTYPCLQVLVSVSGSEKKARLRYDEIAVDLSPECFYTPKNHQNKSDVMEEAQKIRDAVLGLRGQALPCHASSGRHPDNVILKKRYTLQLALHCLAWPILMLFGGGLLVGLVMLTQCLAHICSEISHEGGNGGQTAVVEGGLYRLLRCRPGSPSAQHQSVN